MAEISEFPQLFLPLQGDLLAYVLSQGVDPNDAEDVVQDAACVILRKIGDYQSGTNFRAWAYAVVKNEIATYFRKHHRRLLVLKPETLAAVEQLAVESADTMALMRQRLSACLRKLSPQSRRLVDRRYTQGESLPAIARSLGRPVESLYVTLSGIRRVLRRCIAGQALVEEGRP